MVLWLEFGLVIQAALIFLKIGVAQMISEKFELLWIQLELKIYYNYDQLELYSRIFLYFSAYTANKKIIFGRELT